MTFAYTYHDKSGNLVSDEIAATCREEAFQRLRTQGIRPMRMWETEPALGAGAETAKRRLGGLAIAAIALLLLACVLTVTWLAMHKSPAETTVRPDANRMTRRSMIESDIIEVRTNRRLAAARPRQQLPSAGTNGVARSADQVFAFAAEVLLAAYAEPGRAVPPVSDGVWTESFEDGFYEAMDAPVWMSPDDDRRTVALKRVVAGMKEDASARLASGQSVREVVEYFQTRQRMESGWRERILEQARRGEISVAEANAQLRTLSFEEITEK